MADRPMQEILREALALSATRVIDLFKEWDEDGDGVVTKKEFRRAVPMLGLDPVPSKADIDALFDQWDPDGSGNIDFKELNKILRKSAEGLDPSLQAGAAGKIEMDSKAKTALRKGPNLQRGSSLAKVDIDEASDKSIAEQLRTILSKNAVRVIDLFREWDEDGDGVVSKKEFRKAMPLLGLEVPKKEIDALFESWDPDGSGRLELKEIEKQLRRGADVQLDPKLQAGRVGFGLGLGLGLAIPKPKPKPKPKPNPNPNPNPKPNQAGSMGKIETKSKNKSSREGDKAPKGHGARIGAAGKQGAAGDQSRKTGGA